MKIRLIVFLGMAAMAAAPVMADPWKDESGHGGYRGGHKRGDYKEEYWEGGCKVERKWKGNGEYKEERKCKPAGYAPVVVPAPVYPVQPGVVITGTAVIR
ncbi:hypothetical protein [Bordetella sp. 2513F-2]